MIPLWTSAMRAAWSVWGWALVLVAAPCVAQRVWAMPMWAWGRGWPASRARSISASRTLIRPTARRTWIVPWPAPPPRTATPAES